MSETLRLDDLEDVDRELLNAVQWDFPLESRPYAALAVRLGIPEAEIMERLAGVKGLGVLRQLSAIFDTRALGYSSSLVAAKVDPDRIDDAAELISRHPGVSHNYKRNHAYNLWYTIAVPPGEVLEEHIDVLHRESGASVTRILPTLKLYKIGVKLDMTGQTAADAKVEVLEHERPERRPHMEAPDLSPLEIEAIRITQEDLPLVERPFAVEAEQIGVRGGGFADRAEPAALPTGFAGGRACEADPANPSRSGSLRLRPEEIDEAALLELLRSFKDRKLMRRFAAVMNHRSAGYKANAMGVWAVPEEQLDDIGPKMAGFAFVSHCYKRPTYDDWPYSVFTMVHGHNARDCEDTIAAIRADTGIEDYALLWSVKEYKKTRVRYFTDDWDDWRTTHLAAAGA